MQKRQTDARQRSDRLWPSCSVVMKATLESIGQALPAEYVTLSGWRLQKPISLRSYRNVEMSR